MASDQQLLRIMLHLRAVKARLGSNQTRGRIIEQAVPMFAQHGYGGTSMRKVADEVGIKAASIYVHFPDGKDQLLREGLRDIFDEFLAFLVDSVNPEQSAREQLQSVLIQHITWQIEGGDKAVAWDAAVRQFGVASTLNRAAIDDIAHQQNMYHSYLEALIEQINPGLPARDVATAVRSLCDQARDWQTTGDGNAPRTLTEVVHILLELTDRLIRPDPCTR